MENVLLVVHILACIALIVVVLLQRSEGGALGIGGGGGGGLMSGRGAASALTRVTMGLAALFFVTSLVLTTIATRSNKVDTSIAGEIERESDGGLSVPGDGGLVTTPEASTGLDDILGSEDNADETGSDSATSTNLDAILGEDPPADEVEPVEETSPQQ